MRLESGLSLQEEVGWDRGMVRAARLLAMMQEEPFLVTNPRAVISSVSSWVDTFPTVKPTFNISTSTDPEVLRQVVEHGIPLHFSTKASLVKLMQEQVNLDMSLITFANSTKIGSHIRTAWGHSVGEFWADSVVELAKIAKFVPEARVVLQLGEGEALTGCGGVQEGGEGDLAREARKLGLRVVGLAMGLECEGRMEDMENISIAIARATRVLKLCWSEGHLPSYLHLGRLALAGAGPASGFSRGVTNALALLPPGLEIRACASHWIAAPTATLATRVLATRQSVVTNKPVQYYINEGVFGAFSSILEGATVAAPLPLGGGRRHRGPRLYQGLQEAVVLGPSGDDLDRVVDEVLLPALKPGDWLLFPLQGAGGGEVWDEVRAVEGSEMAIRGRVREGRNEGVIPLEESWKGGALRSYVVDIGLWQTGSEGAKGGDEEGNLEEIENPEQTLLWKDCCFP